MLFSMNVFKWMPSKCISLWQCHWDYNVCEHFVKAGIMFNPQPVFRFTNISILLMLSTMPTIFVLFCCTLAVCSYTLHIFAGSLFNSFHRSLAFSSDLHSLFVTYSNGSVILSLIIFVHFSVSFLRVKRYLFTYVLHIRHFLCLTIRFEVLIQRNCMKVCAFDLKFLQLHFVVLPFAFIVLSQLLYHFL